MKFKYKVFLYSFRVCSFLIITDILYNYGFLLAFMCSMIELGLNIILIKGIKKRQDKEDLSETFKGKKQYKS